MGNAIPEEESLVAVRPICAHGHVACVFAAGANASQLIDRNAHDVRLAVDAKGEAMITYTAGGKLKHVLAWDAVNAIAPTHARAQVAFRLDYAGGWGKSHTEAWKTFGATAAAPTTARRSPGRSRRARRRTGRTGRSRPGSGCCRTTAVLRTAQQAAWELRLSHWTGDAAGADDRHRLGLAPVGSPLRDVHLRGPARLRLQVDRGGQPARLVRTQHLRRHASTRRTAPAGSARTASSRTAATGVFCYSFNPHGSHPAGKGTKYRATVEGPGVTPDVMWQGDAPGAYDKTLDLQANDTIAQLGDKQCRAN